MWLVIIVLNHLLFNMHQTFFIIQSAIHIISFTWVLNADNFSKCSSSLQSQLHKCQKLIMLHHNKWFSIWLTFSDRSCSAASIYLTPTHTRFFPISPARLTHLNLQESTQMSCFRAGSAIVPATPRPLATFYTPGQNGSNISYTIGEHPAQLPSISFRAFCSTFLPPHTPQTDIFLSPFVAGCPGAHYSSLHYGESAPAPAWRAYSLLYTVCHDERHYK